jgi:hypothetical protein
MQRAIIAAQDQIWIFWDNQLNSEHVKTWDTKKIAEIIPCVCLLLGLLGLSSDLHVARANRKPLWEHWNSIGSKQSCYQNMEQHHIKRYINLFESCYHFAMNLSSWLIIMYLFVFTYNPLFRFLTHVPQVRFLPGAPAKLIFKPSIGWTSGGWATN